MSQEKLKNALKQLKENPTSTSVNVLVGQAFLEKRKFFKAKEHFEKALKIDSKNVIRGQTLMSTLSDIIARKKN